MPRPALPSVTLSVHSGHPETRPQTGPAAGHTLTIYADKAIYDETAAKFTTPEDLPRQGK